MAGHPQHPHESGGVDPANVVVGDHRVVVAMPSWLIASANRVRAREAGAGRPRADGGPDRHRSRSTKIAPAM